MDKGARRPAGTGEGGGGRTGSLHREVSTELTLTIIKTDFWPFGFEMCVTEVEREETFQLRWRVISVVRDLARSASWRNTKLIEPARASKEPDTQP